MKKSSEPQDGPGAISPASANALLMTGEWLTDDELTAELSAKYEGYLNLTSVRSGSTQELLSVDEKAAFIEAVKDLLENSAEVRQIRRGPFQSGALRYPIGHGKIVKIRSTLSRASWQSLAVLGTAAAVLHGEGIVQLAAAKRLVDELGKLVSIFGSAIEKIDDPKELAVHDAVLALQRVASVIDFDAEQVGDYGRAYGLVGPTTDEVVTALERMRSIAGFPSDWQSIDHKGLESEVASILQHMFQKRILASQLGRWQPVF